MIDIPQVPLLAVNQTVTVTAEAHPPNQLLVHLSTVSVNGISVSSTNLVFDPLSPKVSFTITALSRGVHFIDFSLSGNDAGMFAKPKSMMIIVIPTNNTESNHTYYSFFDDHNQMFGVLPQGCCEKDPSAYLICPNPASTPNLLSSCSWYTGDESFGIVFANNIEYSVPISVAGVHLQHHFPLVDLPIAQYSCSSCSTQCLHQDITEEDIVDFIKSRALARTFLTYTSNLLPNWMSLGITGEDSRYDNDFDSYNVIADVVQGMDVTLIDGCGNLNLLADEIYTVIRYNKTFKVSVNDIEYTYEPQYMDSAVCFAVSLCNSQSPMYISIPNGHQKNLEEIQSIKVHNTHSNVLIINSSDKLY